jgi:zinc-dependent metalloproteinase lipoprotein
MNILTKILPMLAAIAVISIGCTEDEDESVSTLDVTGENIVSMPVEGGSVNLDVNSNGSWTVFSHQGWTSVSDTVGEGDKQITLTVERNDYNTSRSDTIDIETVDGFNISTVIVNQETVVPTDDYKYYIPVVFHVIYNDPSDTVQNPSESYLNELLDKVNQIWSSCGQDLGVEFYMAPLDTNGKKMSEPGIDRILWDVKSIDPIAFMGASLNYTPSTYRKVLWDQDRYVNICFYRFSDNDMSGVSSMPFTYDPDTLAGLAKMDAYTPASEVDGSMCVSINNDIMYDNGSPTINNASVAYTIAHELGHYFGLFHVFSESADNITDDYCADTPNYDRYAYLRTLAIYQYTHDTLGEDDLDTILSRTSLDDGSTFESDNIMDYYYSRKNAFTQDQAARIRYVLMNAAYIPGPKVWSSSVKSRSDAAPRAGKMIRPIIVE